LREHLVHGHPGDRFFDPEIPVFFVIGVHVYLG
jgi:hypothetical protein